MLRKHSHKSRRPPADPQTLTIRKAVRKGRGTCVICGKHTADTFKNGKPVCAHHVGVLA